MRHPAYLGEDSGSQAIAGESSRILKQSWANPKIVSQTVSHWLSVTPNSLLHTQLEMDARVGIERLWWRTTVLLCLISWVIQADCVTIGTVGFHLVY